MSGGINNKGFSTRQVHPHGSGAAATPRVTPIYLTAGFTFGDYGDAANHFGTGEGYGYTRTGNPTIEAVESTIASLEGGTQALLVSSGQAATSVALLGLLSAGQHIVSSNHIYEGTRGLFLDNLIRMGIEVDFVQNTDDADEWESLIRPETRVLFAESLSNARNVVLDVEKIAAIAQRHGIALVVDSTFATPYLSRPIEHGADVVIHSASKFLAGQGAVIGGVIVDSGRFDARRSGEQYPHLIAPARNGGPSVFERHGGNARIAYLREAVAPRLGTTPSPLTAFLIAQGIETLSLRVERQSANALAVARWLEAQESIRSVDHAGLDSHPHAALAQKYFSGGKGSVFTFTLDGGAEAAQTLVENLSVFTHMTHLGDVRSLVLHPATTSHVLLKPEEQEALGVHAGTLRLSIGIEDAADLIGDLETALSAVAVVDAANKSVSA